MKYRIKSSDSTWLFFTPFAFLNMGGITESYKIQCKKHWWSSWETIHTFDNKVDTYIKYIEITNNVKVSLYRKFPHDRNKYGHVRCKLNLYKGPYDIYYAGYKRDGYQKYYVLANGTSYEEALLKLSNKLNNK